MIVGGRDATYQDCKKKMHIILCHACIAADEEENQAFEYHLLLDEIIIMSMTMIEEVYSFSRVGSHEEEE